jgi:hypothetical protein
MGLDAMAYYNKDRIALLRRVVVRDALRANNRPEVWCIDKECPDTNWGGIGRLHYRDHNVCPPFRQFGGWWR